MGEVAETSVCDVPDMLMPLEAKEEFLKAGEAMSTAIEYCPDLEIAPKWVLSRLAPELAKKAIKVRKWQIARRCDVSSW